MQEVKQLHGAYESAAVRHRNLDLDTVSPHDDEPELAWKESGVAKRIVG